MIRLRRYCMQRAALAGRLRRRAREAAADMSLSSWVGLHAEALADAAEAQAGGDHLMARIVLNDAMRYRRQKVRTLAALGQLLKEANGVAA